MFLVYQASPCRRAQLFLKDARMTSRIPPARCSCYVSERCTHSSYNPRNSKPERRCTTEAAAPLAATSAAILTQALATHMSKVAIIIIINIITMTTSTITITIDTTKIQRTSATDSIRHHTRIAVIWPPMEQCHAMNNIQKLQSARAPSAIASLRLDKLYQY